MSNRDSRSSASKRNGPKSRGLGYAKSGNHDSSLQADYGRIPPINKSHSAVVRPKKALGQHFLTDQGIARRIVDSISVDEGVRDVLEVGPGMGVLTQYLLERQDIDLKAVEVDDESVRYLMTHYPALQGRLLEADFLDLNLGRIFPASFRIIGNFPYNISSQIFFKVLDYKASIPEVVCMIQKEVAERIAAPSGSKTYGILSVLLQTWYDIEYLFSVGSGAFNPPPKVQSAVIRLRRNSRTELGCDEKAFRKVVKTAFGQRRKTLRNALKPILSEIAYRADKLSATGSSIESDLPNSFDSHDSSRKPSFPDSFDVHGRPLEPSLFSSLDSHDGFCKPDLQEVSFQPSGLDTSADILSLRAEQLSVEDFIALTKLIYPRESD